MGGVWPGQRPALRTLHDAYRFRTVRRGRHKFEVLRQLQEPFVAPELMMCGAGSQPAAGAEPRLRTLKLKTILITGASGFLGWHVARKLLERGVPLRALVRPASRVRDVDVERVDGDLRDADSLARAVAGCGAVFHVAADYRLWARDTGEMYRSNV